MSQRPIIVGFFHPYCNAGGGGERVLWTAIKAIQSEYSHIICVVYTGDINSKKEEILKKTKEIFEIELDEKRIQFIYLYKRHYVSPERWPYVTLLGQSLGSLILAYEAINKCIPNIFIDTMGYAFTYPLISSCLDIPIIAYVHYPTISQDMISKLSNKRILKNIYWRMFALAYSFCGHYANLVITNSSWTQAHIESLWKKKETITIYPPCNIKELYDSNMDEKIEREKLILYIAQFRKEKNHKLLLESFKTMLDTYPKTRDSAIKLILIGSVRENDEPYIDSLKALAKHLEIDDRVLFFHNLSWKEIVIWLKKSWIGVNTMWNEHFGIAIVEYMAAALIPVIHDSGGPKLDIVVDYKGKPTGYYASTPSSFAKAFNDIFSMSQEDIDSMRKRARESSIRFSQETFHNRWLDIMDILLKYEQTHRRERIYRTQFRES
ncbi:hypothetical protein T552_01082 [Pneumocystis carinii B80]|uniref:GDP-Man:Man(3)GlcNAc(2)-PP-Dol alpha-1,2-mannosyltransferase n=1 Tax=Pneumocystis carinii (strain B80) TaxID=1408658 RepID=A0A0W4ZNI4_PNEC8|nr:hypothetical protein T552_01082 [Pneumocystis carinii B80]KTW29878.1 hypothetical protein T552_01082 [Pneumocystis carinii B80]